MLSRISYLSSTSTVYSPGRSYKRSSTTGWYCGATGSYFFRLILSRERSALQTGQVRVFRHQESIQLEWKVCEHGVLRTRSFFSSCIRQIGQTLRSLPIATALKIGISVSK